MVIEYNDCLFLSVTIAKRYNSIATLAYWHYRKCMSIFTILRDLTSGKQKSGVLLDKEKVTGQNKVVWHYSFDHRLSFLKEFWLLFISKFPKCPTCDILNT